MMHPLIVLCLAIALAAPGTAFAQSREARDRTTHFEKNAQAKRKKHKQTVPRHKREMRPERGAGFTAGPIGGIGFTYREFDETGLGWQVGGLAYGTGGQTVIILGGQLMHTLKVAERSRFYATLGAMTVYDRHTDTVFPMIGMPFGGPPPTPVRLTVDDSTTNLGAGLGISWGRSDGVTFAFELPLVVHLDEKVHYRGIAPIPQLTLVYNW